MPAFTRRPRYRRTKDAPRIEIDLWVSAMSRRIEGSVSRDWNFGFLTWKYLFRSQVDLSRPLYVHKFTPESLERGAIQVADALWGDYVDMSKKSQKVNGDMTKVRYVPGLSEEAHVLLKISNMFQGSCLAHETRRIMRFATQAQRINFGNAIFVTFSQMKVTNCL